MSKIARLLTVSIVADARPKRDGRAIEEIGNYPPRSIRPLIEVDSSAPPSLLSVESQRPPGAQDSRITGYWQKVHGTASAPRHPQDGRRRGADMMEAFAAAVAETVKDLKSRRRRPEPACQGWDGKAAEAKADKGRSAQAGRFRAKARCRHGPRWQGCQGRRCQGQRCRQDSAAKDGAAKDGAAKDGAAKSGRAKSGGAGQGRRGQGRARPSRCR